jgi:hypothetical protein
MNRKQEAIKAVRMVRQEQAVSQLEKWESFCWNRLDVIEELFSLTPMDWSFHDVFFNSDTMYIEYSELESGNAYTVSTSLEEFLAVYNKETT